MKTLEFVLAFLAVHAMGTTAHTQENDAYRKIIERKYESPVEEFEVLSYSPTTKVLRFDWERNWWGSFNVVEVDQDGRPLYWYDMPQSPTGNSIERIRVITLSGQHKFLEVIDCTHMGNGMLYLYEIRRGVLRLKLQCRVISNLSVHFKPRVANVAYRDLDQDGEDDVVIDAVCLEGQAIDNSLRTTGRYHREYLFRGGQFVEQKDKRSGRQELMD